MKKTDESLELILSVPNVELYEIAGIDKHLKERGTLDLCEKFQKGGQFLKKKVTKNKE